MTSQLNRLNLLHSNDGDLPWTINNWLILEALKDLSADYWDTLGHAYDEENFGAYDKAIEAIWEAENQKQNRTYSVRDNSSQPVIL